MKDKLKIQQSVLNSIKEKMNFATLKESDMNYNRYFKVGDFVINGHGTYGYIKDTTI